MHEEGNLLCAGGVGGRSQVGGVNSTAKDRVNRNMRRWKGKEEIELVWREERRTGSISGGKLGECVAMNSGKT